MRGPNEYTALRVSREDVVRSRKCRLNIQAAAKQQICRTKLEHFRLLPSCTKVSPFIFQPGQDYSCGVGVMMCYPLFRGTRRQKRRKRWHSLFYGERKSRLAGAEKKTQNFKTRGHTGRQGTVELLLSAGHRNDNHQDRKVSLTLLIAHSCDKIMIYLRSGNCGELYRRLSRASLLKGFWDPFYFLKLMFCLVVN